MSSGEGGGVLNTVLLGNQGGESPESKSALEPVAVEKLVRFLPKRDSVR